MQGEGKTKNTYFPTKDLECVSQYMHGGRFELVMHICFRIWGYREPAKPTKRHIYIYTSIAQIPRRNQIFIHINIFSCGDCNLNIIYKRTRVCIIQIAINILIRLYCVLSPLFRPHICECRKIGLALLFRFTLLTNYVQFRSLYITWTERICGELEKYL